MEQDARPEPDTEREPAAALPEQEPAPRSWPRLVGEALWIVLAVLLALAADQWRENKANQKLADKALRGIVEEIQSNRGMVLYFLPRHREIQDALPESHEDWTQPSLEDEDSRFDPIVLRDTAWRTALETNALVHMDYQTVRQLTEVYTFQRAYNDLTRDLLRSVFDLEFHDPKRLEAQFAATKFALYIFVENEEALVEAYDRALGEIEITPTPRPAGGPQ
ncbi:MAG: hypothetical protein AAGM22_00250 [Acidobacteriota bacterium]